MTNVAGFTQLADDVRSVINYLHENEVVVNPDTGYGFYIDPVFQNSCTTPNPDLAPEGVPLSQAEMVAYLNDLVIEAEPPSVTITAHRRPPPRRPMPRSPSTRALTRRGCCASSTAERSRIA